MAIPLEGMVGYIRTRRKPGAGEELELYIDPNVQLTQTITGPVVTKPSDCAGILYGAGEGKLEVRYPEE